MQTALMSGALPAKLAVFPEPYPGELLHSMMARYRFYTGQSHCTVSDELFGQSHRSNPVDLPFRLADLALRLPRRVGLDGDMLLDRHTLFPYYSAFLDAEYLSEARVAALGSSGLVGNRVGKGIKPIPPIKFLRFCRKCLQDAREKGRDPHWLRAHQLPIMTFCTIHDEPLRNSNCRVSTSMRLDVPSSRSCPADAPLVLPKHAAWDLLKRLSLDAVSLLEGTYPFDIGSDGHMGLRTAFAEKGLVRTGGDLDWPSIADSTADLIDGLAPAFPAIRALSRKEGGWLAYALNPKRRTSTDAVLLAGLLLEGICPRPVSVVVTTSTQGPWRCENPLAAHHGEAIVTEVVRTEKVYHRGKGEFRHLRCACGYEYSIVTREDGSSTKPFRLRFGPSLARFILETSLAGVPFWKAAKTAKSDPASLKRIIAEEGIPHHWDIA
ncbi:TnsD family Tn7-like transposition protein [Sphingomonas floccifaciens]